MNCQVSHQRGRVVVRMAALVGMTDYDRRFAAGEIIRELSRHLGELEACSLVIKGHRKKPIAGNVNEPQRIAVGGGFVWITVRAPEELESGSTTP